MRRERATRQSSSRVVVAARKGAVVRTLHYAPLWGYFAACGFLIFTIDIPLDESRVLMFWELRFLALPLALVVFGLVYRHRIFLRLHATKKRKLSVAGLAVVFYFIVLISGFA
jgi:hypothetical protein